MTPPNGEGRVAPHDAAPKSFPNERSYFAALATLDQEVGEELAHFASLRAKLAEEGYSLSELSCGGFLIARRNLVRNAPDLRAVGHFLRVLGGRA